MADPPVPSQRRLAPSERRAAVEAVLERNRQEMARAGRLIFALDATSSRQPSWRQAVELQSEMFDAAAKIGGLQVQLVFFGGDQCRVLGWTSDPHALAARMRAIVCQTGQTQWGRVFKHARREHQQGSVSVVAAIGDCCEESLDTLCGEVVGMPRVVFFQEGDDAGASVAFPELARRTGGACFKLGPDSGREFEGLLRALGVYAAGGVAALSNRKDAESIKLLLELERPSRS